jgi:hypothetical protein
MDGSYQYTEYIIADSQQGVVVQTRSWARFGSGAKLLTIKSSILQNVTEVLWLGYALDIL